jgi:hypothetical protein
MELFDDNNKIVKLMLAAELGCMNYTFNIFSFYKIQCYELEMIYCEGK